MDLGLKGATAAVTGATKGMGRAIVEILADEGANVAVLARGQAAIDETVASLDVLEPSQIDAAFAAIDAKWGSLNILVNTIGPAAGRFENLTDEDWLTAFGLGTMATVRCVRAALPLLRRAEWARIVNFSAHSIQRQSEILPAYTASKAAVASVSKNLAKSLAKEGILVNTVSPGTIVTASFTEALHDVFVQKGLNSSDPYDVMRWIEEVFHQPADLVFLASRRNGYATGANVNVDGGSDFV